MRTRLAPIVALVVLSACGGTRSDDGTTSSSGPGARTDEGTTASAPPGARVRDGFFTAAGAPPPLACEQDADCIGDTIPAADGCCQDPRSLRAHARAYRAWVGTWRAAHCEGVVCPPPPSPSRPPDCAFDVRCVEGGCVDRCDPPSDAERAALLRELAGSYATTNVEVRQEVELTAEGAFAWTLRSGAADDAPRSRGALQVVAPDRVELEILNGSPSVAPPVSLTLRRHAGRRVLLRPEEVAAFDAAPDLQRGLVELPGEEERAPAP